jgi:hypothetical protein
MSDFKFRYDRAISHAEVRHRDGRELYGEKSYLNGTVASLRDALEELADLINYAAYTHAKVSRLIEEIEAAAKKEQG